MHDTSSFGYWLRRRRKALDLTQQALASQAGCATITLRKIEAGELRPSAQIAERLVACLALQGEERHAFLRSARSLLAEDDLHLSQRPVSPRPAPAFAPAALPIPPNGLIGREQEVAVVVSLLQRPDVRLLTLTGPGGTGKTRLALEAAAQLVTAYAHGVCFVNLAPIQDPTLVTLTIAQALGIKERRGETLLQTLGLVLRTRQLLLVLDNLEHVLPAAPDVAALLADAAQLTVLATSRASLRLSGEHECHVPPLVVPDALHRPPLEQLAEYESVRLFVARAKAVQPGFELDADNVDAVAQICRQLDGLPLAIELAAARVKLFSPRALINHLRRPLALLTNGPRDMPARQQTLRNTIDWSYHLLGDGEQRLFRRLSMFAGGAPLDGLEAVCVDDDDGGQAIVDGITALLDHSLIQRQGTDSALRVAMLETTREYALERLIADGELETLRARHAAFYRRLSGEAEPHFRRAGQAQWLARIACDIDNIRAALAWSVEHDAATAVQIAGALWWFWYYSGRYGEGLRWSVAAFERSAALGAMRSRAQAAVGAAMLALYGADLPRCQQLCEAGRTLAQAVGDQQQQTLAHNILGTLARTRGDHATARRLYEESLALARTAGDPWLTALALGNLGIMTFHQDDPRAAAGALDESLSLFRTVGDTWYIATLLHIQGRVARLNGDVPQAAAHLRESLALFRTLGNHWGVALSVGGLATVARAQGDAEEAAELLGAEEALREAVGEPLYPTIRRDHERVVAELRTTLGEAPLAAAWARGRELTAEQIFARVQVSQDGA
jgi:predicted ATPase/transcriptional regulator with XRE-family HTH domain